MGERMSRKCGREGVWCSVEATGQSIGETNNRNEGKNKRQERSQGKQIVVEENVVDRNTFLELMSSTNQSVIHIVPLKANFVS